MALGRSTLMFLSLAGRKVGGEGSAAGLGSSAGTTQEEIKPSHDCVRLGAWSPPCMVHAVCRAPELLPYRVVWHVAHPCQGPCSRWTILLTILQRSVCGSFSLQVLGYVNHALHGSLGQR